MRFAVEIIAIMVLGYLLEQFLPWWSVAIAAFAGGALVNTRSNFVAGFLAIAFLWVGKALITEVSSDSEFADQVARIFMLHSKSILLVVTFFISGFLGGFAAMTGGALTQSLKLKA